MVEGEAMVALRRLVPAVAVKLKLLKVATPSDALTELVPESTASVAEITTDWLESEPVVTVLPSAS